MNRRSASILAFALVFVSVTVSAQEKDRLTGLVTKRAGSGLWATFSRPVQVGAPAEFRAFQDGEPIGVGRVAWCASVAPYEAYLVNIEADQRRTSMHTEYQLLFRERASVFAEYRFRIVPGCYAVVQAAQARREPPPVDRLRANLDQLTSREDFRRATDGKRLEGVDGPSRLAALVNDSTIEWQDPVTDRLVLRVARLLREGNRIGGSVPQSWFPADLAKGDKPTGGRL